MANDSDKALVMALGKPKSSADEVDEDYAEDSKQAESQAAEDLISAVKSGDSRAVVDAFKMLRDACGGMGGYEE